MTNEPLHISDDRLIDLVNHLLSEEEERTTLSHIESCAECEARFRLALADHETAKSTPAPSVRSDGQGVIAIPRRHPWRRGAIAVVAAAAVVIAGVAYFVSHPTGPEQYWVPIALDASSLRSADGVATGSAEAFAAYQGHNAQRTIELLQHATMPDDEMIASLQRLMLASAMVNAGDPKEAIDVLEKLQIFSLPVKWREQAEWVEYLALRDAGRANDARARLEKLTVNEGDIGARARAERDRIGR